MKPYTSRSFKSVFSLAVYLLQASQVLAGTQFASHVTVNTPARSYTHGVGHPLSTLGSRAYNRQQQRNSFRSLRRPIPSPGGGYPKTKPVIPFNSEEIPRDNSLSMAPWQYNNYNTMEANIPVLPPSPYKVDSPDPESLWPEGLFLPPMSPPRFGSHIRRSDNEPEPMDPYLLEGSEAIAAVKRADDHGHLFFHDIPHIESLLANQELRVQNQLKPHRIASIRHTWPYNRP